MDHSIFYPYRPADGAQSIDLPMNVWNIESIKLPMDDIIIEKSSWDQAQIWPRLIVEIES